MRNYFCIGDWFRLKVSSRNIAPWGYEALGIRGLSLFTRCNDGSIILASWQPRGEAWHWAIGLGLTQINKDWVRCSTLRRGQWHDFYRLPFGWELRVSRQDFHIGKRARGTAVG